MGFLSATKPFNFPILSGELFLSKEQHQQLAVLFDRLFPGDHENGIPGATDALAARFVSQLLALDVEEYYKIADWRIIYQSGLKNTDDAARITFDTPLSDLTQKDADSLLTLLSSGKLKNLPEDFDQRGFFRLLLEHCIKGCFADPRWGGNENGIMWRWLGWVQPAEDIDFGDG